ncbi:MAG: hypothetical protein HN509_07390 [Halobacteriovoraceae bacterium]|nr:hypothetical protein [Halobacteriovoraceae bacterium]
MFKKTILATLLITAATGPLLANDKLGNSHHQALGGYHEAHSRHDFFDEEARPKANFKKTQKPIINQLLVVNIPVKAEENCFVLEKGQIRGVISCKELAAN